MTDSLSLLQETIDSLLDQEYSLTESLFHLLQQEHHSLEKLDIEQLPSITQKKSLQLKQLDTLAAEREKVMRQLPKENGGGILPNIETYLQYRSERKEWWQDFKNLLENCQRQNTVNGRIIHLNQQSIERSLNIIRSQSVTANVYDTKGNQHATNNSVHAVKV